ncbi:MAG: hypothetical protein KJN64_12695 [Ignavibacteria bacterium]|nr:hypothetical protein [Ignavibacteria bacterium]MBT8381342.1 hypothetical protein [Ignavibacteria bacterium]MBT8391759.1 hypothetical protein [Ignavibacteria bacterium]
MRIRITMLTVLVATTSILLFNCTSPKENKTLSESDIPPGHAQIVGVVSKIEPVSDDASLTGPCSNAPCIALVKVTSAVYGASFPQLVMEKDIRVKFNFTLEKTTPELFPNMKEEFPGLQDGQEFTALVSHLETMDESAPQFQIYAYETN